MKSLAHPDWPYKGTCWEWRGFAKETPQEYRERILRDYPNSYQAGLMRKKAIETEMQRFQEYQAVYQKQNFGPELK